MKSNQVKTLGIIVGTGLATLGVAGLRAAPALPTAPAPLAAPKSSVAVINLEHLMAKLDETKSLNADLKITFDNRQKELDDLINKAKALEEEIKILPEESKERRLKSAQLYETGTLAKTRQGILQRLIDTDKGELVRGIYLKVTAAVDAFAKKEGIDIVLLDDRGITLRSSGTQDEMNAVIQAKRILFAAEPLDITDRVANIMNTEFSSPAKR
ncbi:MAG: OmpH family outer membrane protein [Phycisphaerales bacterium]|nr:OmpH family outer membrane protein [Phycisphaerales bacterium]